jgi:uncharacterized caspase-like protein
MRIVAAAICAVIMISFGVGPGHADKRVALVVGNTAYQNTPALPNPANDAEDMAAALRAVGFEVIVEKNVNKRSLEMAMARFGRIAQNADAALFYYAGHGIQYRGLNYLVPIDARLEDEFSVNYELTRIDDVLFALSGARGVKLLVLDACRNNPLADRLSRTASRDVGIGRGLSRIEAARGMIIAYATQPNQVAEDGNGRNSPFTGALIKEIEQPGLEIATLFRRVAVNVDRVTGGKQFPELSISMSGEFYLNTRENDSQAWVRVRQSSDAAELREFVRQYPQSFLSADAKTRIAALEAERATQELAQRGSREQAERLDRERRVREQAERGKAEQEGAARQAAEARISLEKSERDRIARDEAERAKVEVPTAMLTLPPDPPKALSPPVPGPSGVALVAEIKKELKRVGCYTGRIDDKWTTADTKASVQKFILHASFTSSTVEPTENFLDAVRAKSDRVCPLECGAREVARNGRCVAKSCPNGLLLGSDGACEPRTAARPPEGVGVTKPNRQRFDEPRVDRSKTAARSPEAETIPKSNYQSFGLRAPLDNSGTISMGNRLGQISTGHCKCKDNCDLHRSIFSEGRAPAECKAKCQQAFSGCTRGEIRANQRRD